MKTKQLTEDQHREIARWVSEARSPHLPCVISRAYGKTSRVAKLAFKAIKAMDLLRSEMDNQCWRDLGKPDAELIYYPESAPLIATITKMDGSSVSHIVPMIPTTP